MSIGIWQVVLILLIVLIIFGAGKLPRVMGDVAKGVKNFKAGLKDDGDEDATATTTTTTAHVTPPPLVAPRAGGAVEPETTRTDGTAPR